MIFPRASAPLLFFTAALDNTSRELHVSLSLQDRTLHDRLSPTFDGFERPFVFVSGVKKYLTFVGTTPASGTRPDTDHYSLLLKPGDFDLTQAMLHGVAVGLDTNVGEVWMQTYGDDYPVT